ncbi:hypothetical protein imdm_2180 [gamma proteobacterium IMCC2047]|nr:hypothetical protein imdm_2180 [gamma proteobacterium IMCC2047]
MKIFKLLAVATLSATFTLSVAQADTLEISVSKQAPDMQTISRPYNGMDKADVERVFGAPYAINGPVGEPPISSWSYEKFTVYFEDNTVLHSVLVKPKTAE